MKTIRVGLAGFGMSGQIFQAPFIEADERFELCKVYERSSEKSKSEYPNVSVVHTFEELLTDDIDLVIISTPNATHVPFAKSAIKARKNVVIEKPIAATSAEVRELMELADKNNVIVTAYQNRRFDGDYMTIKRLYEEGRFGDIVEYEAHYDRFVTGCSSKKWKAEGGVGVNILYDLGVHMIDQAYDLFGMPLEVYADMSHQRPESAGIDEFEVIMYYADKRVIASAGELVAMPGPRFMINGRKATYIKYGEDVQADAISSGARPIIATDAKVYVDGRRRKTADVENVAGIGSTGVMTETTGSVVDKVARVQVMTDGGAADRVTDACNASGRNAQESGIPSAAALWGAEPETSYGTLYSAIGDHVEAEVITTECGFYGMFYDRLYASITDGEPLLVELQDSLNVLRIIEAALESNEKKFRVQM